ncbi:hypothetical protein [Paenibacillus chitinolyticus]|uniref:hypothetical protein n=1 Tax=Paenibacillus chitinolyticus TaxID=79263 RepID=UPI00365891C8
MTAQKLDISLKLKIGSNKAIVNGTHIQKQLISDKSLIKGLVLIEKTRKKSD